MPPAPLRLATWNVWFGPHHLDIRAELLLDELAAADLDVLCLQEVTPRFVELLRAREIFSRYALAEAVDAEAGYGTALLTRLPVLETRRVELPTSMGRHLLLVRVEASSGRTVTIATAHLESRRWNGDVRIEQLDVALPALRATEDDAVFCGDFNFDDGWDEDRHLHAARDFRDVWRVLRGAEDGYTVDTARNAMTAWHKGKEKQTRYDRVLWRTPGDTLRPASVALLGTRCHPADTALFPSDHFGLLASFTHR